MPSPDAAMPVSTPLAGHLAQSWCIGLCLLDSNFLSPFIPGLHLGLPSSMAAGKCTSCSQDASLQQARRHLHSTRLPLQLQATPFSPRWVEGSARRLTAWDSSRAGLSSALGGIIGDVESYVGGHAGAAPFRPPFLPPRTPNGVAQVGAGPS